MNVCANCFKDEEIKKFIESASNNVAICDCCGTQSSIIDVNELADFFENLLSLFVKDDGGTTLIPFIQKEWDIFSSNECAQRILSSIINQEKCSFSLNDKVVYCQEIKQSMGEWGELKTEIKEKKRYFFDEESLNLEPLMNFTIAINEGSHLYRARIIPAGCDMLKIEDMGCPPKEEAWAGRANPLGIPYLYLCGDMETTLYEIRSVYLDRICIGEFKVKKELHIVDFTNKINLFYTDADSNESLKDVVRRKFLFENISEDLSRPLRRFDTPIEYVPTQLICEYCKLRGTDGVLFNSSLHQGGKNIVLFNGSDAECISVTKHEISKVEIKSKQLS